VSAQDAGVHSPGQVRDAALALSDAGAWGLVGTAPRATAAPAQGEAQAGPGALVQVWDLPLRIFHWGLVLSVTCAIVSGKAGGRWLEVHHAAGVAIVGLLVFRLVWGLLGTQTARFAAFAPTPRALRSYLRGRWRGVGHNPLGALSVAAMLGLLALQASTGLFSDDDIDFTGPLNALVSGATAARLTGIHRIAANGLFGLLALHVAAVAVHLRVKKDDILRPMWSGWKRLPGRVDLRPAHPLGLACALAVALAVSLAADGRFPFGAGARAAAPAASTTATAPHAAW